MGTSEHAAITDAPTPGPTLVRRVHLGARRPANWISSSSSGSSAAPATPSTWRSSRSSPARPAFTTSPAAIGAFCVAVASNFAWNRLWTFDAGDGHAGFQAARFFAVSLLGSSST